MTNSPEKGYAEGDRFKINEKVYVEWEPRAVGTIDKFDGTGAMAFIRDWTVVSDHARNLEKPANNWYCIRNIRSAESRVVEFNQFMFVATFDMKVGRWNIDVFSGATDKKLVLTFSTNRDLADKLKEFFNT